MNENNTGPSPLIVRIPRTGLYITKNSIELLEGGTFYLVENEANLPRRLPNRAGRRAIAKRARSKKKRG